MSDKYFVGYCKKIEYIKFIRNNGNYQIYESHLCKSIIIMTENAIKATTMIQYETLKVADM